MSNREINAMYKSETGLVPESNNGPVVDEYGDVITFDDEYILWLEDKLSELLKKSYCNG